MTIVRFTNPSGAVRLGNQHANGTTTLLEGDLFGSLKDTGTPATITRLLAPLKPAAVMCIGLNYRKHAEEGKQAIQIGRAHV